MTCAGHPGGQVCRLERRLEPQDERAYCGCEPGFAGPDCRRSTSASFGGPASSLVLLRQPPEERAKEGGVYTLEFAFRTTLGDAHLASGEDLLGAAQFSVGPFSRDSFMEHNKFKETLFGGAGI